MGTLLKRLVPPLALATIVTLALGACGGDGSGNGSDDGGGSPAPSGGGDTLQIRSQFDDFGNAIATDPSGNIYIGGVVGDTFPGQSSAGRSDAFVQKLNGSLAEEWTRQFGTDSNDAVRGLVVGSDGNVYAVGETIGEFPGYESQYFGSDAFVRVYDNSGTELWTDQFGTEVATVALAVTVGEAGIVYVGGYTEGSLPGFTNGGGAPLGQIMHWNDAFLRKYDAEGNEAWTQQFGDERHDEIHGVVIDGSNGVYVAGYTDSAFNGFTNPGGRDAFVRKYDTDGNELWTQQFGSESASGSQPNEKGLGIALDSLGNIYIVGSTSGQFQGQTSGGADDGFVRKMDSVGGEVWTRQFGGEDDDTADSISVDATGNVFVIGNTESSIPGGRGAGVEDGFAKSFDTNGGERWTKQIGTRRIDGSKDVAVTDVAVYVIGGTEGEIGPGGAGKGNDVDRDVYVKRLSK